MSDRNSGELILTLGEDFQKCLESVKRDVQEGARQDDGTIIAKHEFNARQLVRSAFAYIEGVSFSLKVAAVDDAIDNNVELTQAEMDFAFETSYQLDNKGNVVVIAAHINLVKNIKFAFNLYSKAHQLDKTFDANAKWWNDLSKAIKIRDRLMHPRIPEDLDVAPKEVIAVVSAVRGFESLLLEYTGIQS